MNDDETVLIHAYTRKQAIEDGVLREAGPLAQEAGIRLHVALTAAVWAECVTVPESCDWQDETGRLWDVLTMLTITARNSNSDAIRFTVAVDNGHGPRPVQLRAVCGPGDDGEPVITVMMPDED